MIINDTYFVGEIHIPQTGATASALVNQNSSLQYFIDEYEREIIELALGKERSNEFYTQIDANGSLLTTADPKWGRLLNGHSYLKNGITYYWRGLIETKGTLPTSLMAYYVYYKYITESVTQRTTLGVVKADGKNGDTMMVSASPTLSRAWRKMYKWYQDSDYYGYSRNLAVKYMYKGAYVEDYFNGRDNTKQVSLYQFLVDNESDYAPYYFTPIQNVNQFGI